MPFFTSLYRKRGTSGVPDTAIPQEKFANTNTAFRSLYNRSRLLKYHNTKYWLAGMNDILYEQRVNGGIGVKSIEQSVRSLVPRIFSWKWGWSARAKPFRRISAAKKCSIILDVWEPWSPWANINEIKKRNQLSELDDWTERYKFMT